MSQQHAQRMIDASKVRENLTPIGVTPKNEAQARELAGTSGRGAARSGFRVGLTTATAKDVRTAVKKHATRVAAKRGSLETAAKFEEGPIWKSDRPGRMKRNC